jgi:YHS domain-containing protein
MAIWRSTVTRLIVVLVAIAAVVSRAQAETPPPELALKGLDPVALANGKEMAGNESIEAVYGRFKYWFASEANKQVFRAKPGERGIQFGGACGKMGPFSGSGSPDRYYVYDGRIYIFASEFCRDAFRKDPEKHIDRPNPVPEGTEDERARGAKLIERALVGFGGAKVVDSVNTLTRVEKIVYRQGGKETIGVGRTTWRFPDAVRVEEDYGTPYGHVVAGGSGFELYDELNWTLEPAMRDDAWRQALREPLLLLRHRHAKGFVAVARGPNTVEVSLDGATSTWTLSENTDLILKTEFRARRGTVGDNAVAFDDFRTVSSLVLPHKRTEFFNGKELTIPEKSIESIDVDGDLRTDLFVKPE